MYCSNIVICTIYVPTTYVLYSSFCHELFSWRYFNSYQSSDAFYFGARIGILLQKLFWPTMRKTVPVIEKNSWSIEQFIRTVVGQNNLETECFFNLFLEVSQIWYISTGMSEGLKIWRSILHPLFRQLCGTVIFQIRKNNWDLETCRKSLKRLFLCIQALTFALSRLFSSVVYQR